MPFPLGMKRLAMHRLGLKLQLANSLGGNLHMNYNASLAIPLKSFSTLTNSRARLSFDALRFKALASSINLKLRGMSQSISSSTAQQLRSAETENVVAHWMLFCASLVFAIVILGGVTRLTESGLSITEWNVIRGMKPPTNEREWNEEFEKYKQFPEYKLLNKGMTMEEFKRIFYYEWAHRNLGRFIGVAFVLPAIYFGYTNKMNTAIKKRSVVIASLIGFQGLLGWLMVRSGLDDNIIKNKDVPRVNHFWLSAHLSSAFVIYATLVATGMEILARNSGSNTSLVFLEKSNVRFKIMAAGIAALVFITSISGAWVAGLDAGNCYSLGLIYNEFPLMGESLVPSDMWALSESGKGKWYNDLTKNPAAVQFNHRLLACTTFTAISCLWALSLRRKNLPKMSKLAANSLMGVACMQVTLGISTLLTFVPIPLAAAHQGGSLTLLTMAIWLLHTLRYIR